MELQLITVTSTGPQLLILPIAAIVCCFYFVLFLFFQFSLQSYEKVCTMQNKSAFFCFNHSL